jgi:hypothetical protein
MRYYAGVTPHFGKWKKSSGSNRKSAVLHYFDNSPTAGVSTPARRLRQYLAKRVARGDRITFVRHSTGGLDIRRLLCDLAAAKQADVKMRYAVDGTKDTAFAVASAEILRMVKRIVFLSVPQFSKSRALQPRDARVGKGRVGGARHPDTLSQPGRGRSTSIPR